jgi:hemoglobin-like flavoprotein
VVIRDFGVPPEHGPGCVYDPGTAHLRCFYSNDPDAWARPRDPDPIELADTVTTLIPEDEPMTTNPADATPIDSADTGSHRIAVEEAPTERGHASQPLDASAYRDSNRPDCPHCRGTGKVLTTNDLLRASLELLGDDPAVHNEFTAEFYDRLFDAAPYLAKLFPPDLRHAGSDPDGRGKAQRDKLLSALLALGTSYEPENPEAMEVLNTHLASYGRKHAAFDFPDGVRPPSLDEYRLVKIVLFNLLHDVAGDRWIPEFDAVWSEAYDHAYRKMGDAAWEVMTERRGQLHPRSVRQ